MTPKRIVAFLVLVFFPLPVRAITLDEESKYGREIYLQIARMTRLYTDPYVSLEMAIVKKRLEDVADLPFPVKFSIIDSTGLDAFATIGGYVYVTTGILEQADKEEEIAGILGHEFAHVGRRHVAKAIEKEKAINWVSVATMLVGLLIPNPAAKAAVVTGSMGAREQIGITTRGKPRRRPTGTVSRPRRKRATTGSAAPNSSKSWRAPRWRNAFPSICSPILIPRQGFDDTSATTMKTRGSMILVPHSYREAQYHRKAPRHAE